MRRNAIGVGWGGGFHSLDTVDDQDIYSGFNCEWIDLNLIIYPHGMLASAQRVCSPQIFDMSRVAAIGLGLSPDNLLRVNTNACVCERQCQMSISQPAAW